VQRLVWPLFFCVVDRRFEQFDEYLTVSVSPRRLQSVRVGEVELRAAFAEAKDGQVIKLLISRDAT